VRAGGAGRDEAVVVASSARVGIAELRRGRRCESRDGAFDRRKNLTTRQLT
jgi:hypothetical protein